ncbi:MAG: propionyl-CoA synthetase [Actinomycetota bacterium]|nr:propionyl-CoA synthetase [Actinomycetota bacterium]
MYQEIYDRSLTEPDAFWLEAAKGIDWVTPPTTGLDSSNPPFYRWFSDGELNTCFNAIDRHVEAGRGEQAALIYDSPVTGTIETYTYAELQDLVSRFAGGLRSLGVEKGDRVVIYMPMIPQAAIAMLACARLGAIHSVVFGGFAPKELAIRIDDAEPKVIVAGSCGIEIDRVIEYKPLLDSALDLANHQPVASVIFQRPQAPASMSERDVDWDELMASAEPAGCLTVSATDPLYILYTSGTTAIPKGVVRDNGGHAVALRWSMPNLYDAHPGDVYWAASDVGWVVGHSYIVYAPLLTGCTTVLYEGKPVGTPDPGAFWRVISEHGVSTLFCAPTAFRAIKRDDPDGEYATKYDLSTLRSLFLAGERLDPDTYHWAKDLLGVPVVDHWWQTESGWPIVANPLGIEPMDPKPGSSTLPVPGYDIEILDADGQPVGPNTDGLVAIRLPLPPGTLPTLWGDPDRFVAAYLSTSDGYYLTGDGGYIDDNGYVYIMGRVDDVINVAGHRLSTGSMEEVLADHPDVAECAVIGIPDELKGQVPLGFVVLKAGVDRSSDEMQGALVQMVRDQVGAVASLKRILVVRRLPKTRSGKILRRTMRSIVAGEEYSVPSTIDDPVILDELAEILQTSM